MRTLLRALGSSALAAALAVGASADTIYMRNGSVIRGTVVGFSSGVFTVMLDDGSGGASSRATLAESEIDRIEFDEGSTAPVDSTGPRTQPRRSTSPSVASRRDNTVTAPVSDPPVYDTAPSPAGTAVRQGDVTVRPDADWTNSNFRVERGSRIRITATGSVKLDPTGRRVATPAGINTPDRDKLLPTRPTGSLIAVIGDDNDEFIFVGTQAEFVAERDGYLFLSINEGNLRDNGGSFSARVVVEPPSSSTASRQPSGMSGRRVPPSTASTTSRSPVTRPSTPPATDPGGYDDPDPEPPVSSAPPSTRRTDPAPSTRPDTSRPSTSRPDATVPAGTVVRESDVQVLPNVDWTNTKIRVDRGQTIRIDASGSVKLDAGGRAVASPAGTQTADSNKLIPDRPTGALIAVIGDDNDDFIYVGPQAEWVAQRSGILFLSVNEGNLRDNTGSFAARVRIEQPRVAAPDAVPAESSRRNDSLPTPVVDDGMRDDAAAPGATAPKPQPAAKPAAPQIGPSGGQADLTIQAKSDWTSTQIVVKKGMRIRISASGTIKLDPAGAAVTPAGTTKADTHKLIADKPTGGLVAVVGDDNNDYIFIGTQGEFVAQRDGLLFLGINEGDLVDNTGFFTVRITVTPARR